MTVSEWATTISGTIAVLTVVGMGVRFIITHYLREIRNELTNNGGSSMKDKVDLNTDRLSRVEQRVDQIYIILSER
jgi:hypothetical protein